MGGEKRARGGRLLRLYARACGWDCEGGEGEEVGE